MKPTQIVLLAVLISTATFAQVGGTGGSSTDIVTRASASWLTWADFG